MRCPDDNLGVANLVRVPRSVIAVEEISIRDFLLAFHFAADAMLSSQLMIERPFDPSRPLSASSSVLCGCATTGTNGVVHNRTEHYG